MQFQLNYFFKINMERPCPLWPDERECSSRECGIEHCDDEVPAALRDPKSYQMVRLVSNAVVDNSTNHRGLNKTGNGVILTNSTKLHSTTNSHLPPACSSQSPSSTQTTTCNSFKQIDENGKSVEKDPKCSTGSTGNQFDPIDTSLTEGDKAQLDVMDYFEDSSDRFCDFEGWNKISKIFYNYFY